MAITGPIPDKAYGHFRLEGAPLAARQSRFRGGLEFAARFASRRFVGYVGGKK